MFATAVSQITYEVDENAVFELPGGVGRVEPPNCFLNPPNTLSNYVLAGQLYIVHIQFTSEFCSVSDLRKVQPPANFSQFKHCENVLFLAQ